MTNKQEKQLQVNELTLFQQFAVEGEVASIMCDCDTDEEKVYQAFLKLVKCQEHLLLVYKTEFAKYVSEEDLSYILMCRYSEIIPMEMFVKKYVKDIKSLLGEECGSTRIFKLPPAVVVSKITVAIRELMKLAPVTTSILLEGITKELGETLPQLYQLLLVFKQNQESMSDKHVDFQFKIKMLSAAMISHAPILSLPTETQQLEETLEIKSAKDTLFDVMMKTVSEAISTSSMFKDLEDEDTVEDETLVYIVKKIDKNSNNIVQEKVFKTQEAATKWINSIVKDYPELIDQFNFIVELVEQ